MAPETTAPVPSALLEAVASPKPVPALPASASLVPRQSSGTFARFDHTPLGVRGYLERHGIRVTGERTKGDATWLYLDRCPVVQECVSTRGGTDIAVCVSTNSAIAYKNQHNRGTGLGWVDVRDALEPGYKAWVEARGWATGGASGGFVSASGGGVPEDWPAPQPLPEALPPVIRFDPSLLPEAFGPWIKDVADRVQCPIDFPAVAAMIALAGVVGRKIGIRPKRHDDWLVVPNLWGGAIGRPGVMKTPAIVEPLKPLRRMEIGAKGAFDDAKKTYRAALIVSKIAKKETEKKIRKIVQSDPDGARRMAAESFQGECERPTRARYIVNDSTVEKLGEILNENPNGVLVYRDELIGLLKSLDKEGQEGARSFYLEAWNGTGRYTYDRIARGTIDIEAAIVSIIGGIQPGPISQYLRGAAKEGMTDDGLMQRFQLLVWPDISADWVNVDRWPDTVARNRAYAVFEGLNNLEPILLGADTDRLEPDGIPFLRFTPEAQKVFDAWRSDLEALVRGGELHPALESHLAKYRSLIPSLALLIHLADGGSGAVGLTALNKAIAWGVYLRSHAERVFSQAIHPDLVAARSLARKILAGELKDGFSLREVYRKGWSGLASPDEAEAATKLLIDLDWLAETKITTTGRPTTAFRINPRLHELKDAQNSDTPSGGTDKGDRSPPPSPYNHPSGGSGSASSEGSPKNEPDDGWGES
ncbi:MAG: DUF3987 domain-containing protein [Phycisphaerales bacterium]|nr:DUF3987 domain-containing protein [Phycisphaerales bacterium]